MRGKALPVLLDSPQPWITPAHAGKRKSCEAAKINAWDHPRTCGEKLIGRARHVFLPGSPPHMRGKESHAWWQRQANGITPAHAGKRYADGLPQLVDRDHPRTCGEKLLPAPPPALLLGSPPHMRGKVPPPRYSGTCTGITPAHAGKSIYVYLHWNGNKDHPRTCGEKQRRRSRKKSRRGSPPHMRGKASRTRFNRDQTRITPAHAGKSRISPGFLLSYRDHPRTCGEKTRDDFFQFVGNGSPPHMRGKVKLSSITGYLGGITPAHAGKRVAVYR